MQLVIGGAFAGKRKIVKDQFDDVGLSWLSSYDGETLDSWRDFWNGQNTFLVVEGWENWLREDLRSMAKSEPLTDIREKYRLMFRDFIEEESRKNKQVILIMLEMGKGIVPIAAEDRLLRDLAGWIQQDAAALSDEVVYVWHGLSRRMK
ncbi:bifunctional adenosylcobinamide kinase/adenosylcobinamide-phosphate guanylyltransferase [Salipaludibacillus sp. HK11]|uniref:bifunctional adenosylcobinamide kinase/adenosylcobinamide-phosphate guanylyltransferase n=1 Tax=Salipaludibacillus sp. HK11 TaxID=3394320 RepID=UPI0039FD88F4